MLDKVVILSCRKQAYIIFTDRDPIGVSSDEDVVPLLLWFFDSPNAYLAINGGKVTGIELRKDCSDEVTVSLSLRDVA